MDNIHYLITQIATQLSGTNADNCQQAAWWILEAITQKSKTALILEKNFNLSISQEEMLANWLYKLKNQNYPLQYLLGSIPFLDLNILVKAPTLIPRPETEEWVDSLIATFQVVMKEKFPPLAAILSEPLGESKDKKLFVLDIGVGTGCIGLALAKAFPNWNVLGVDISDKALALAEQNKLENKIENINFIKSDLFECLPNKKFDLIVSNPPYINQKQYEELADSVAQWEDRQALVASVDGLSVIKNIAAKAHKYLVESASICNVPSVVMEVDYTHITEVKALLLNAYFSKVEIKKDLAGKERVVYAYL